MAYDTLIDKKKETDRRKSVADAIRQKTGTTTQLDWHNGDFESAINGIQKALPSQEKSTTISGNGETDITPDLGKTLSKVHIKVNVPSKTKPEEAYNKTFTQNGEYEIAPNPGKVITSGTIKVQTPQPKIEQSKTGTITSRDQELIITPDDGKVLNKVTVTANVPSDQKPEVAGKETINQNRTQTFTPPEGKVFKSFTVTTEVPDIPAKIEPIQITKNGTTQIKTGIDGYGPITVKVPSDKKPEETYKNTFTENGTYPIEPSKVGNVITGGEITINTPRPKPEEKGNGTITANGSKTFRPTNGSVYSEFTVNTNIPYITYYTGAGAPNNATGADGDFYFQK